MSHSWHRCDMRPLSVAVPMIEGEFANKVLSQIKIDDGWREAIIRAMTNEGPQPNNGLEIKRVENAMANLKKQHLWEVISDDEFRKEYMSLERQKRVMEVSRAPLITPNLDRAAQLLSDLPALWHHPGITPAQRR